MISCLNKVDVIHFDLCKNKIAHWLLKKNQFIFVSCFKCFHWSIICLACSAPNMQAYYGLHEKLNISHLIFDFLIEKGQIQALVCASYRCRLSTDKAKISPIPIIGQSLTFMTQYSSLIHMHQKKKIAL